MSSRSELVQPASIHIQLLGPPCWQLGDDATTPLAARDAALLAVLALEGVVARDRIAAWLWPEAETQGHANLSLRQRLFRLRRECGHPLVEAGQMLSLAAGVRIDIQAQPLPTEGELLAGQDFSAFEALDEWLRAAREALGRRQADALAGRAARLEDRGALAEAIAVVERIVATWPATEHAWRRLMRLHWRRADRAAAVAAFERFERQVCREWGLRPSSETLSLLATIERDEAAAPAPQAALPSALLHPPVLVGRAGVMQALASAWSEGRAALLLAPGGMGKSRLLDAFIAQRPGVLRLRARPGDTSQPYATLAHALDEALSRFAPALEAPTQAELTRLLPRLGPPPGSPASPGRLRHAIVEVWRAAANEGLQALVWDDLHWADRASLELLHGLLAEPALASLRQLFAARPDEGAPADAALPAWLGDSLRVLALKLSPWNADDLHALLPTLGLPPALAADAELPERLLRQTGGQPFFVLETLKTMVLAASTGAPPGPAPAVGAMIERRIGRLAEPARRLLQLLALSGTPLPLAPASAVLQRPLVDLSSDWTALAEAQLVRDDGVAHDLVREAIVDMLPAPARQALHLVLARSLSVQPGVDATRLALHWRQGGVHGEAAAAWRVAALAAVRTGRLQEADALFAEALQDARAAADAALLVEMLAAAQPTRLLRAGPTAMLAELEAVDASSLGPAALARLYLLRAEAELSQMRAEAADAAAAEALALCDLDLASAGEELADPRLLADATLMRSRTLAWSGRAEAGIQRLQAACERADAEGDLRRRLHAQGTLADVLAAAGHRVQCVQTQGRALMLARTLGDRFETAVAASNLAVHTLLVGDAAATYEASAQALTAFAEMGIEHVNRLMCASVHVLSAAHHGRFDEALATARPLLEGGEDPVRRNLRNTLSTVFLWLGQADESEQLLPPLDDASPLSVRLTGLFTRLRWCAWAGHDGRAERQALQAICQAHPRLREDAHFYRAWALFDTADAPDKVIERLDRLAMREANAGAGGLARALALAALQIVVRHDPAAALPRARALASTMAQGFHPAVLPSEAWWTLAKVLGTQQGAEDRAAAKAAAERARAWVEHAHLPQGHTPQMRALFREQHPLHALVLGQGSSRP